MKFLSSYMSIYDEVKRTIKDFESVYTKKKKIKIII